VNALLKLAQSWISPDCLPGAHALPVPGGRKGVKMAAEIIKVMIVDDHPMVRKGLALFVAGYPDMQLVAEASNAAEAGEKFDQYRPDVVLMDMVMPGGDGASAIANIRQRHPTAAIIALTSYGEEQLIEAALRAGAHGFLYKNVSVDELADAIRQVYRGRTILDPKAADVMLRLVSATDSPSPVPVKSDLSDRERDVLKLLVQGLTNKQIAVQLNLQPSTVKQYISKVLSKLNVQSRTEAVAVALQLGLLEQ
jgi:DNA-binding NarL/FixJ family response regulator